jgi:SAM-dependent methyltransferase
MDRQEKRFEKRAARILKHVQKSQRGIEVGGWFAPLAPKSDGYACLALDVFDLATLKQRALDDPDIDNAAIPKIQEVDLLGTSTEIESLVEQRNDLGQFDYIVSSHNFEHLPNPIKFLQGSGKVLKLGGILSMAIPDRRLCFDIYKPASTLAQWIEAFFERRVQPSRAQVFNHMSMMADYDRKKPYNSPATHDIKETFSKWTASLGLSDIPYEDAHCWTFTSASFELIIRDAHFLGLSPFTVKEVTPRPKGIEFYAHLVNSGYVKDLTDQEQDVYKHERQRLLRRIVSEPQYLLSIRRKIQNLF